MISNSWNLDMTLGLKTDAYQNAWSKSHRTPSYLQLLIFPAVYRPMQYPHGNCDRPIRCECRRCELHAKAVL